MEEVLKKIQEELMHKGEVRLGGLGKMYLHDFSSSTNKFTKDTRLRGSTIYFEEDANEQGEPYFAEWAKNIREELQKSNTFSIPSLGNFFKNSSNKITFLASPKVNLSKETFGFKQVRVDGEQKDWLTWLADTNTSEPTVDVALIKKEQNFEPAVVKKTNTNNDQKVEESESLEVKSKEQALPIAVDLDEKPKEDKILESTAKDQKKESSAPKTEALNELLDGELVEVQESPKVQALEIEWIEQSEKRPLFLIPRLIASILLISAAACCVYLGQKIFLSEANAGIEIVAVNRDETKQANVEKVTASSIDSLASLSSEERCQLMASVMRSSANYIAKLKVLPGEFYVVAGTYSSENFAFTQCMRWKNMGIEVACASLVNSNNYKIIMARYADKDDAEMFKKQTPVLDGAPIVIQKLEVKYP